MALIISKFKIQKLPELPVQQRVIDRSSHFWRAILRQQYRPIILQIVVHGCFRIIHIAPHIILNCKTMKLIPHKILKTLNCVIWNSFNQIPLKDCDSKPFRWCSRDRCSQPQCGVRIKKKSHGGLQCQVDLSVWGGKVWLEIMTLGRDIGKLRETKYWRGTKSSLWKRWFIGIGCAWFLGALYYKMWVLINGR